MTEALSVVKRNIRFQLASTKRFEIAH